MVEQRVGDLPVMRLPCRQAEPDREPLRVGGTPRGLLGSSGSITRHSKSVRSYRLMPMLNQGSTQWARPPAYDRACLAVVAITPHTHYDSNCSREEGNAEITLRPQRADLPALFLSAKLPFHAVTAYNILRSRGVPLGKRDYEGRLPTSSF